MPAIRTPKLRDKVSFTRRSGAKALGRVAKIETEANGQWVTVYTGDAVRIPPIPEDKHKDFTRVRPSQLTYI